MKKILIGIFVIGIIMSSTIYYMQVQQVRDLKDSEITDVEFEQMLEQEKVFYVYFFSPACTECKSAEPKIIQAIQGKQIKLAKINITEYPELFSGYKQQYNLPGVPVILRFENGIMTGGIAGSPERTETYAEFFKGG